MSPSKPRETPVIFYRTAAGAEPVREWLRTLSEKDRRSIGQDLAVVQFGWPIGLPICRSLGAGLWEVRSSLPSGRSARLLFFFDRDRIGVVNGFIKKTARTPVAELELARRRMKEMLA